MDDTNCSGCQARFADFVCTQGVTGCSNGNQVPAGWHALYAHFTDPAKLKRAH